MANRFGRKQRRKAREQIATLAATAELALRDKRVAERSEAQFRHRNMQLEEPFRQLTGRQREFVQANVDELTRRAAGELQKHLTREAFLMAAQGIEVKAMSAGIDRDPRWNEQVSIYRIVIPEIVLNIMVETRDDWR